MAGTPLLGSAQPGRTQVRCAGQVITDVVIRTQGPSYGSVFERSRLVGDVLSRLHTATAPDIVRNFMLMKAGDRCSALRRSESERILRSMPFIAEASVTAYADGDGVRLEVVTVDEPSIVADAGVSGSSPFLTRLTMGSANLGGNGVYTSLQWRDGGFYRDAVGLRYRNYQLWGRPHQLDIHAVRRELGNEWGSEVFAPFLTDIQRTGWRFSAGGSDEFVRFLRGEDQEAPSLGVQRYYFDAGAVARIGPPGLLGLVGAQFSLEGTDPDNAPVLITDSGIIDDTTAALVNRYSRTRSARLNALLGLRRIRFLRVTGFDALSAPQDLRTGIEAATTIGTSLGMSSGAARDERFMGGSLYLGAGTQWTFAALEAVVEARIDRENEWRDVLSHGRLAWYVKPHSRHLITADLSWARASDARVPVQLALGERIGGVRGYEGAEIGGGSRLVGRLEERWRVGAFGGSVGAAVSVFTDVGAVWAGDVPLGRSSGMRQSVGMGFIVAVPARSQRMWRMDVAFPLDRRDGAGFELRLSSDDRTRRFWRVPSDIGRARERVLPQSVFNWRQ